MKLIVEDELTLEKLLEELGKTWREREEEKVDGRAGGRWLEKREKKRKEDMKEEKKERKKYILNTTGMIEKKTTRKWICMSCCMIIGVRYKEKNIILWQLLVRKKREK